MNITTLKKVLPVLMKAKVTPWIWGFHGKGKSESIETWCKDLGYLCFNFRLNTQADVGDFLGLQDFTLDPTTGQKVSTSFFMPDWLKQCYDFCSANPDKLAVIFIDEINRASRMDLIGPVFQMALDYRLHTYKFPENLRIICASNPDTSNYSVLSLDDKALFSRFCHIMFNPSREEWRDYAVSREYDNNIIDFIGEQPDFLEESDLERFSLDEYAKPDRRKWSAVNSLLKKGLNRAEQHEVFSGLIGIEGASAFYKFLDRDDKPLSLEDILDNYEKKAQKRVIKYSKENRTDILHNATAKVSDFFKTNDPLSDKQGTNLLKFMEDLPLEVMFQLAHNVYKDRRVYDFAERNPELKASFIKRLSIARGKVKAEDNQV